MNVWEQRTARYLRALRLDSIRNKLLVFAVLATLVPSVLTGWISYEQNRRALTEKTRDNLRSVSDQAAREMDLWIKERLYDLRVFASSYEVSENLERLGRGSGPQARARLTEYLESVRQRIADYEALLVFDAQGGVAASTRGGAESPPLPSAWLAELRVGEPVLDDAAWDPTLGRPVMTVAVPVHGAGRFLGVIAARLSFATVTEVLDRFAVGSDGPLYLVTAEGVLITGARGLVGDGQTGRLTPGAVRALSAAQEGVATYDGIAGVSAVGTLRRVSRVPWSVVAEVPAGFAFREVVRLRNVTALLVSALVIGIGSLAWLLGLVIVRPLDRLAQGAAQVAGGDLDVDLPVISGGEVGYLTQVFNNMVSRLRHSRQELERLSRTDSLTGLANRRHLMEVLASEAQRARRHGRGFAVLMADIDHFKPYNDTYGHQAGDDVLARVGAILRDATRGVDWAARYGGEEFLVLMPETGMDEAVEVAARICQRVGAESFRDGRVTLSVGVALFPDHGDTVEAVIASADAALYRAKREGRDHVARAAQRRRAREARR